MEMSVYLSIGAFIISLCSLAWSIHIGRRDRGKLRTTCKLYSTESNYRHLEVKAVNQGRRTVILAMFGANFPDGSWNGTHLEKPGIRVSENEAFTLSIKVGDHNILSPEGEEAIDLWFEDTLGRRYKVKNAKDNLRKLWGKHK